jgi:hypothetical protein
MALLKSKTTWPPKPAAQDAQAVQHRQRGGEYEGKAEAVQRRRAEVAAERERLLRGDGPEVLAERLRKGEPIELGDPDVSIQDAELRRLDREVGVLQAAARQEYDRAAERLAVVNQQAAEVVAVRIRERRPLVKAALQALAEQLGSYHTDAEALRGAGYADLAGEVMAARPLATMGGPENETSAISAWLRVLAGGE